MLKLAEVNERFKSGVGQGSKKYAENQRMAEKRRNVRVVKVGFHAEVEDGSAMREVESPSPIKLNDEKKNYLYQMYGTPRKFVESPSPSKKKEKKGLSFTKIRLTPTRKVRTPRRKIEEY